MSRLERRTTPLRNMPSAWEIILAVNELARKYLNADPERLNIADPGRMVIFPEGFRCDMHRWQYVRRHFKRAANEYLEKTGLDVYEALREHEATLRSRHYAPQLYVERR